MIYLRLLLIIMVVGVPSVYSQEWAQKDATGITFNCDAVRTLVEAHGDLDYVRIDDAIFTVEDYHAVTVPGCLGSSETSTDADVSKVKAETSGTMAGVAAGGTMFQITVDAVVNLRACASTTCDRLGRALDGDRLDVVGEDGDWYEIAFESGRAYIAAWLTRKVVDPPKGLLADFQFAALNPNQYFSDILHGTTSRRGTHWLNLTRADGSPTAYELQAMNWGIDDSAGAPSQPRFFGWGKQDWTALPYLMPESSFYVYVVHDQETIELPISNYSYVDSYNLGFDEVERPSGVVAGAQVRILVADGGQAEHVRNWIGAGNLPEAAAPPAQPAPPGLSAGDGAITLSFSSPADGSPVYSYEAGYREVGSGPSIEWVPNISGEGAYTIENLRNGAQYEIALVAIGRGGRSRQSRLAAIELPSQLAGG